MHVDVVDLQRFYYKQPLGAVARRLVGDAILRILPPQSGQVVMGLGFATPYLRPFLEPSERLFALMPAGQGILHWPPEGPSATALCDDGDLPLPDQCVDCVVAVHALEMASSLPALIHEIWRVLRPGGQLLVVVANRRGLWARFDSTPFGQGRPFSRPQLKHLLQDNNLPPDDWAEALFVPPVPAKAVLRAAATFERVGHALGSAMPGVLIVRATKQHFEAQAVRSRGFSVRIAPPLMPSPAPVRNSVP